MTGSQTAKLPRFSGQKGDANSTQDPEEKKKRQEWSENEKGDNEGEIILTRDRMASGRDEK